MKRNPRIRSFNQMTVEELEKATAQFEKEFVADSFAEAPAEAKEAWRRAREKPHRSTERQAKKLVSIRLEKGLLKRCDRLAKKKGVSRAILISRGLKAVLAADSLE